MFHEDSLSPQGAKMLRARERRRFIQQLSRSVRSSLTYATLLVETILDAGRLEPLPVDCRHLTLIIPGFLGTRGVMRPLEAHLISHGHTVRTVNVGLHSVRSFAVTRRFVEHRLHRIRARCPFLERVNLIGHSMGGLVAAELFDRGMLRDLDVRLVTLGAPFRGTPVAYLASAFSEAANELTPGRRGQPSYLPIEYEKFLSLAGSEDALAPSPSCWHKNATNRVLPLDHAGLVVDPRAHRSVTWFLKT